MIRCLAGVWHSTSRWVWVPPSHGEQPAQLLQGCRHVPSYQVLRALLHAYIVSFPRTTTRWTTRNTTYREVHHEKVCAGITLASMRGGLPSNQARATDRQVVVTSCEKCLDKRPQMNVLFQMSFSSLPSSSTLPNGGERQFNHNTACRLHVGYRPKRSLPASRALSSTLQYSKRIPPFAESAIDQMLQHCTERVVCTAVCVALGPKTGDGLIARGDT